MIRFQPYLVPFLVHIPRSRFGLPYTNVSIFGLVALALLALAISRVAHSSSKMDFSGAQALMGTFKTSKAALRFPRIPKWSAASGERLSCNTACPRASP